MGRLRYRLRVLERIAMLPSLTRFAFAACLAVTAAGGLAACAPTNTNTTYTAGSIGVAAQVRYGTIVGMRPVQIAGSQTGTGAAIGGLAGGIAGSAIGGDWRARTVAGVGGALLGAGAGALTERGLTQGSAVEFTIRPDGGGADYTVVQTNELALQVGERVAVSFGDRARLNRVAGPTAFAPTPGYAAPASLKR
jgi:outer membrane lipoprotein SlyB